MPGALSVVEQIGEAIDGFDASDLMFIDPTELGPLVEGLQSVQARLDAVTLEVTRVLDRSVVWSDDGALTSAGWLRTRLGCSQSDARRQISDARSLLDMAFVAQALAEGTITRARVAVFARACTPERARLFERDEALLLERTAGLSFQGFSRAITRWIDLANDVLGLGEPDPVDRRTASSKDASAGMWAITAMLDALDGTEVDNELRRLESIEFDKDWADARERLGDNATVSDLARNAGQRLADALLEMARRSASTTKPGEPATRVVNLRMDYDTFVAETAAMTSHTDRRDIAWPTNRVSETQAGTVLAPSRILDPTVAVHVRRVVFGPKAHRLEFGHSRRLYTGGLREAIIERDQRCMHPYCDAPPTQCQVDHVIEFEDGGHTNLNNGQLLCGPHNRQKHRDKRQKQTT